MKHKSLFVATAVLGIAVSVLYVRLYNLSSQLEHIGEVAARVEAAKDSALTRIESTAESTRSRILSDSKSKLKAESNKIVKQHLDQFEKKLKQLKGSIKDAEDRLEEVQERKRRAQKDLPEKVDLDELNQYYAEKWDKSPSSYSIVESFNTNQGTISFRKSDFSFVYVPSSNKLAWMKIGKEDSDMNSNLIKAWLEESAESKVKQGYRIIYNRTRDADYGEYTEKMYRKGDMYFKTYYQYQRVQGTYDRYSLEYTFYVEIGSKNRKKQYNKKIGS